MSEHKVGSVARIEIDGKEYTGLRSERGWYYIEEHGWGEFTPDRAGKLTKSTPLVVLDLKAANPHATQALLAQHLIDVLAADKDHMSSPHLAEQVREQTKPPRIPEPGKYGVVKAVGRRRHTIDTDVLEWVNEGRFWRALDSGTTREWSELIDPKLVRDGVDVVDSDW